MSRNRLPVRDFDFIPFRWFDFCIVPRRRCTNCSVFISLADNWLLYHFHFIYKNRLIAIVIAYFMSKFYFILRLWRGRNSNLSSLTMKHVLFPPFDISFTLLENGCSKLNLASINSLSLFPSQNTSSLKALPMDSPVAKGFLTGLKSNSVLPRTFRA